MGESTISTVAEMTFRMKPQISSQRRDIQMNDCHLCIYHIFWSLEGPSELA